MKKMAKLSFHIFYRGARRKHGGAGRNRLKGLVSNFVVWVDDGP